MISWSVHLSLRVVIVECKLPRSASRLDEVSMMARSIGYNVVSTMIQNRNSVHHSYCIGAGKLEELGRLVQQRALE